MKDMILCAVYKSGPDEETYLFVDYQIGFESLPEALKEKFESPILVTQFKLSVDKKLARTDAAKVMQSIEESGFYLQLPPQKDAQLFAMSAKNEKLTR